VNNLLTRSLTGLVFGVVVIGSILVHQYLFSLLFLIVTVLSFVEFFKLFLPGRKFWKIPGIFAGVFLYITTFLVANLFVDPHLLIYNIPVIALIFIAELFLNDGDPMSKISLNLTGYVYIALPFSLLNFFFNPTMVEGMIYKEILIGFFVILWINDTTAYLVGSRLGKHKLWQKVSPNKTWEGIFGGIIFGLAAAYILSIFYSIFAPQEWIVFGAVVILFGTLGDLVESMIKRSLKIKDTGKLLPGHGGVLDRFDGMLLAIPFVLIYVLFII